ncbi:MAG: hypothetical protein FWF52_09115 [Candidatus Azobacteroides sp.]|nr:hypothetical protein [Candidatus Azobacteroides sp.]
MDITAICIVGFCVLGIYKIIELFVRRRERLAMIERWALSLSPEETSPLSKKWNIPFLSRSDYGLWPLRLSLLFIGVGLGCIIAFFVQYNLVWVPSQSEGNNWATGNNINQMQSILYFSFITIFGGLGLLIAYFIEAKQFRSS